LCRSMINIEQYVIIAARLSLSRNRRSKKFY
jgi:hypothetical protein